MLTQLLTVVLLVLAVADGKWLMIETADKASKTSLPAAHEAKSPQTDSQKDYLDRIYHEFPNGTVPDDHGEVEVRATHKQVCENGKCKLVEIPNDIIDWENLQTPPTEKPGS